MIDIKDRKLIQSLELDGRASIAQIARKISTSKEVANYRLHRLIDAQIIVRFESIINQYALGYEQYRILANIDLSLLPLIKNKHLVLARARRLSKWNVDIAVWAKNNTDFKKIYQDIVTLLKPNNVLLLLVTDRYTMFRALLFGSQKARKLVHATYKEDSTTEKLLALLKNDGRMQATQIAKKLGISAVAVAQRITALKKHHVLMGVRVVLDMKKLGFDSYQIHVKGDVPKILAILLDHPQVTGVRELLGPYDLEFGVDVKNANELEAIFTQIAPYITEKNLALF